MKNTLPFFIILFLAFISIDAEAQKKKSPAANASGEINGVEVNVDYHQPSAHGREIMGGLVPYGEVWRTGANNATTISFSSDVMVAGEELAAGKYSLFTIPGEDEWTIIFNSETDIWGTQYSKDSDVLRVEVPSGESEDMVETFDISVADNGIVLAWENTMVEIPVEK
ncbi:MAG: DUF2911 domain-containing protein [Fulvivirga sp.]